MGKVVGSIAAIGVFIGSGFATGWTQPWLSTKLALGTLAALSSIGGRKPLRSTQTAVRAIAPPVMTTMEENLAIPLAYGQVRIAGNVIHGWNNDLHIAFCQGEIDSFNSIKINDVAIADVKDDAGTGVSHSEYTGTNTQIADTRFSVDERMANRGVAYIALTFPTTMLTSGGIPNVTSLIRGKKCRPLANLTAGTEVYSRNNAVTLADFLINTCKELSTLIDLTSFQTLETYCNAIPTGQTIPRYRLDYSFTNAMSVSDALSIIEASFNGRAIYSQGVWKAVYEKSGSLSHTFTEDNIVQESFSWRKKERKNIFRIHYLDSSDDYRPAVIEMRDETSIAEIGDSLYEEEANYITNTEIAQRRCQLRYDKGKHCQLLCELTGLPDSADLEVLDIVSVTHTTAGWMLKTFTVISKQQDEFARSQFTLEEYNASVYGDVLAPNQSNSTTNLPSPFADPGVVTGLTLTQIYKLMDNGTYMPQIQVDWTPPSSVFSLKFEVWYKWGSYVDSFYLGETSDNTFKIDAPEISTYYVKVKTINIGSGVKSDFCTELSITVAHETIDPLDGFDLVSSFSDLEAYPTAVQREVLQQVRNHLDPSSGENLAPVVAINYQYSTQPVKNIVTKGILPRESAAAQITGTGTISGSTLTDAVNDWTALASAMIGNYLISFSTANDGTEHRIINVESDGGVGTLFTVTGTPKTGIYFIVTANDI